MNQEQPIIGYDQFWTKSKDERIGIFNDISAENRALLIKTHNERWLATNRHRLNREQIAAVECIINSISAEWYRFPHEEKIKREFNPLIEKVIAVLSMEDQIQLMSNRADYVPTNS